MKRLRDLSLEALGGGFHMIDLGASGGVNPAWEAIARWINVIGFDPNAKECERLNSQPTGYHAARFLPYALAGETRAFTLYRTHSIYCWSLLKPRSDWLSRFTHSKLFDLVGTDTIEAWRLDEVPELASMDIDAMKVDTQGLELPILTSSERFVDSSILIETETGMTQNYEGETTFDQVLHFMESRGFGLFDINTSHRIARKNRLNKITRNEQILWCEAVWLRDFYRCSAEERARLTRPKALRALALYANHGCIAFGLEAAALFRDLNLIEGIEYDALARDESAWGLPGRGFALRKATRSVLDYVPRKILNSWSDRLLAFVSILDDLRATRHPLKKVEE